MMGFTLGVQYLKLVDHPFSSLVRTSSLPEALPAASGAD
jgi:hypothetical protein